MVIMVTLRYFLLFAIFSILIAFISWYHFGKTQQRQTDVRVTGGRLLMIPLHKSRTHFDRQRHFFTLSHSYIH